MAHLSENPRPLKVEYLSVASQEALLKETNSFDEACVIRLPSLSRAAYFRRPLKNIGQLIANVADKLGSQATLVVLGEVIDLVRVQAEMPPSVRYQHWVAIRRPEPKIIDDRFLPNRHYGALILTRYKSALRHTKTRIRYTYCPVCDRTTKDYGGKKHTYHKDGTLISDVWHDISCELGEDITPLVNRFADFFGTEPYKKLRVMDCRPMRLRRANPDKTWTKLPENGLPKRLNNQLLEGDCIELLKQIPDNSIDFAFADPPYNLRKKYLGYSDDLEIREYFDWCDKWIAEMVRVLKPGRTCALLNIPLWAVRHFLFMETVLQFQNWIVWDALAFPVRLVMPSHYTILCFSKGEPRELPGLIGEAGNTSAMSAPKTFVALKPLADDFCLRSDCVERRRINQIDDRGFLTDTWADIHRLKHNSRRVDHPCQLPPHLMYRLLSIFTRPNEVVLDCFNGAGTTTLAAHQLGRRYIGIEISDKYCRMARERHAEIEAGLDPFRKEERVLTAKNSPVPRLRKQKYKVTKKALQLEVKRIALELGYIPAREEIIRYGKYSIEYYDKYFVSWGEVRAAARTTGMTETRTPEDRGAVAVQLGLNL